MRLECDSDRFAWMLVASCCLILGITSPNRCSSVYIILYRCKRVKITSGRLTCSARPWRPTSPALRWRGRSRAPPWSRPCCACRTNDATSTPTRGGTNWPFRSCILCFWGCQMLGRFADCLAKDGHRGKQACVSRWRLRMRHDLGRCTQSGSHVDGLLVAIPGADGGDQPEVSDLRVPF